MNVNLNRKKIYSQHVPYGNNNDLFIIDVSNYIIGIYLDLQPLNCVWSLFSTIHQNIHHVNIEFFEALSPTFRSTISNINRNVKDVIWTLRKIYLKTYDRNRNSLIKNLGWDQVKKGDEMESCKTIWHTFWESRMPMRASRMKSVKVSTHT